MTPAASALHTSPGTRLVPMRAVHLDDVMAIERRAYEVPWTHGNFVDALAAGYLAERLLDERGALLGYFVAMEGVDEMHLLNLTVAPERHGCGHARALLDALVARCRATRAARLWLEVRAGNARARALYLRYGLAEVGCRRGYYPTPGGALPSGREDAVVMSLDVDGAAE